MSESFKVGQKVYWTRRDQRYEGTVIVVGRHSVETTQDAPPADRRWYHGSDSDVSGTPPATGHPEGVQPGGFAPAGPGDRAGRNPDAWPGSISMETIMKTASFFPKNTVFHPDDAAPIPIHKVTSLVSDHGDAHRLRAVIVKTFGAGINDSCKVGTPGRLTVDVPVIFRADGRWADQAWIGHDFGRLVVASNHPSCPEDELPFVTLVFRPTDR